MKVIVEFGGLDRTKDGSKEENITAVTTRDLCDYYKKVNGTDNLRKTYLAELLDYGFIDEQDSVIHQKHKICTAIIDLPSNTTELEEESLDWLCLNPTTRACLIRLS
jgi:hypothetical protein